MSGGVRRACSLLRRPGTARSLLLESRREAQRTVALRDCIRRRDRAGRLRKHPKELVARGSGVEVVVGVVHGGRRRRLGNAQRLEATRAQQAICASTPGRPSSVVRCWSPCCCASFVCSAARPFVCSLSTAPHCCTSTAEAKIELTRAHATLTRPSGSFTVTV